MGMEATPCWRVAVAPVVKARGLRDARSMPRTSPFSTQVSQRAPGEQRIGAADDDRVELALRAHDVGSHAK